MAARSDSETGGDFVGAAKFFAQVHDADFGKGAIGDT